MNNSNSPYTKHNLGLFGLRFGIGVVFAVHGYDKVVNFLDFSGFLGGLGFPLPEVFTGLLILLELGGGIALILGFATQLVAGALVLLMAAALVLVKGGQGFIGGAELDLLLLFSSLSLALLGPGRLKLRFADPRASRRLKNPDPAAVDQPFSQNE